MRLLIPLAVIGLSLAGCASLRSTAASGQLDATKGFVAAETGFDAAVQTADAAIKSGQLSTTIVQEIKTDVDKGYGYVVAGRTAVTGANSVDLTSATSALTILVADLAILTKG